MCDNLQNQEVQQVPGRITQMKTLVAQLEELGKEEFKEDIAALKEKITSIEEKAKGEVIAEVKSFREKHGVSWQVAAIGGGFIIWQIGAAIARLLGH